MDCPPYCIRGVESVPFKVPADALPTFTVSVKKQSTVIGSTAVTRCILLLTLIR